MGSLKEKRRIAVIDCETDPFKPGRVPQPFIWGYYCEKYGDLLFNTTAELADFLRDENVIAYAHNGGKFDFHYLVNYLEPLEPVLMINSRLVKAKIGKCELRDSYAILPVPLSAYKKDDIDYNIMEPHLRDIPKNRETIIKYLKGDCRYLYDLVNTFIAEYGRQTTIASAAIKILQKMENIKVANSGGEFFDDFSRFYFGGRVEAIQPGIHNGDIKFLDINSAYPFAMLHKHPIGTNYLMTTEIKPKIKPHGFYRILAKSYGAFCYRDKKGLCFDRTGELKEYFVTGHELLAAQETGAAKIIKHIAQYVFLETMSFKNYVDHFWSLRQTTKKGSPENIFAKLFLNSAYGKFCANPRKYETYVFADAELGEFMQGRGFTISGDFDKRLLMSKDLEEDEMRFFNVATGASITGFVRAMLLRAINSVDNPIYCDTDSLIYTGNCSLNLSKELGEWKLEGEFVEACIAGKKLYGLKAADKSTKTASKGGNLNYKSIKLLLKGDTVTEIPIAPVFSWHKKPYFQKRSFRKTANVA